MAKSHLSASDRRRLKKFYFLLCFAFAIMAFGAYVEHSTSTELLLALGAVVIVETWNQRMQWTKELAFVVFLVYLGVKLSCTSVTMAGFDAMFVVTTLLGISIMFGCFYRAAAFSSGSWDLYWRAFMSSSICSLVWVCFASAIFGGTTSLFEQELYFVLLLVTGFVVGMTRLIHRLSS